MERSSERSLPVAGVFCALCNNPFNVLFNLTATEVFFKYSVSTEEFLRSIRVKPWKNAPALRRGFVLFTR
jgi:hypothetical protein